MYIESRYEGYIKFQLKEIYTSILITTLQYFLSENSFTLEKDILKVNCLENEFEIMVDALLFIEKYGKINSGNLILTYGIKNVKIFTIEENQIKIQEKIIENEYDEIKNYKNINDIIKNEAVLKIENKKIYLMEKVLEFLDNGQYKIFNLREKGIKKRIETSYHFLREYEVDETETRKMMINGHITYLYEPFMKLINKEKLEKEKIVQLPDGKRDTVCSQCIFRVKKITEGCKICIPKKI